MSGIAALNYQAIKNSGLPVGAQVMMPYTTVPSFTAPSGEVFVKNSIASVIPASQCHPSLIPALTAENDVTFSIANKIDLNLFGNGVTGIPSVLSGVKSATGSSGSVEYQQTPTIGLYVDSMYYFFLRNGYVTTTDLQYFSQKKTIPQLVALNIVDVKYIAGTWYFIDSSGYIASMTDLSGSNLAINQTVMMPASASSYGYIGSVYINGVLYIYGSSKTTPNAGYSIIKSADFVNWSVVIEVTSGASPVTSLCQGSGTGSATEIFGCCAASDVVVKSVNNGASFTQVSAFSGNSGVKSVLYSARTGKYYAVSITSGNYLRIMTGSTGTLATATFSSVQTISQGDSLTNPYAVTLIDNGSNIGFISGYSNCPYFTYINGGSYGNTQLSADASAGMSTGGQYISAYPIVVNGNILVITSPSNYSGAVGSSAKMMLLVSGATMGVTAKLLWFPVVSLYATMTPPATFSGVSYSILSGQSNDDSNLYYFNLYKFNADLSAFSLALQSTATLANVQSQQSPITSANVSPSALTWTVACNANTATTYAVKYDGVSLATLNMQGSTTQVSVSSAEIQSSVYAARWSSLFSAYLYGGVTSSSSSVTVLKADTLGAASSSVFLMGSGIVSCAINLFDVLSGGHGIAAVTQQNSSNSNYSLSVFSPSGTYNLMTDYGTNYGSYYLIYDISGIDGNKYVGVISQRVNPAQTTLSIFKLSATSAPIRVLSVGVTGVVSIGSTTRMRRVFQNGNKFYLTDISSGAANKNSLLVSQSGSAFSFVGAAYCNLPMDSVQSGTGGLVGALNSATLYSTTAIPAVYLPPGTAGSYIKVK